MLWSVVSLPINHTTRPYIGHTILKYLSVHVLSFRSGWCVYGVIHRLNLVWWNNHHFLTLATDFYREYHDSYFPDNYNEYGGSEGYWRRRHYWRSIFYREFYAEVVLSLHCLGCRHRGVFHWNLGCHVALHDAALQMLLWQSIITGEHFATRRIKN